MRGEYAQDFCLVGAARGAGGGVAVALQGARAHAVARGLDETVGFPRPRLSEAPAG